MSTPAYTEQSLGKRGSEVVTGAVSSKKFAILVAGPQGATISAITCSNKTGAASLVGDLPARYTPNTPNLSLIHISEPTRPY